MESSDWGALVEMGVWTSYLARQSYVLVVTKPHRTSVIISGYLNLRRNYVAFSNVYLAPVSSVGCLWCHPDFPVAAFGITLRGMLGYGNALDGDGLLSGSVHCATA